MVSSVFPLTTCGLPIIDLRCLLEPSCAPLLKDTVRVRIMVQYSLIKRDVGPVGAGPGQNR